MSVMRVKSPWLRIACAVAAVVGLIAACTEKPHRTAEPPTTPSVGDAQKETPGPMDDSLRSLDHQPDLSISLRQGTEHFRDGQITLTVHGDGRAEVEQLRAGTTTRTQARLPAARVTEIGRALADHRFTAPRTTSLPREPGDTPLVLRAERPGAAPLEIQLWYADRYQDRDLDAIIKLADAVIQEVRAASTAGSPTR
jgi:hypothetical protein